MKAPYRQLQRYAIDGLNAAIGFPHITGFERQQRRRGIGRCPAAAPAAPPRRCCAGSGRGNRFGAMRTKVQPQPDDRADDAVGHEGDQNDEHQAENEFPEIADGRHLLAARRAAIKPDRRADGRADQRSGAADHRLDDELPRRIQREGVRRHIALENAEQCAATAGKDGGQHEGELVCGHVVAQRCGAQRILSDRRQHGADRRQHDEAREHEADEKKSRNELVARPAAGETIIKPADGDARRWHAGQSVLAAGPVRERRIFQKVRQFAERERDHREINADAAQRQKSDNDAEDRCGGDADRHGEPHVVQRAAGQKIRGDKAAGAVERALAERQETGAAEQQIEAEAENSPDQNAREEIDGAKSGSRRRTAGSPSAIAMDKFGQPRVSVPTARPTIRRAPSCRTGRAAARSAPASSPRRSRPAHRPGRTAWSARGSHRQ